MRAIPPFLAFLAFVVSTGAREVPFDFSNGYIVLHASVDAHPVTLLVDSGASVSVLSVEAAQRLHLALGKGQPVDGVDAGATAFSIKPVTASAGNFALAKIGLAVDLRNAEQLCGQRVDGLIGADFFKGRVTQIDYARHRLVLLDKAPADGERLPLRAQNGVYCLPVSVNGSRPRWTRLDTGCNDALHWVVPRTSGSQQRRGVTIGFITNTEDETLVSVGLGHITLPNVETALHGSAIFPGEAGLLGSEVLSQYRVTIDARGGHILLAPAAR